MNSIKTVFAAMVAVVAFAMSAEELPPLPEGAFTYVVIPDTQLYRGEGALVKKGKPQKGPTSNPAFESRVDWIAANIEKENIVFVKDDIILNSHRPFRIEEILDALSKQKNHAFMYLLIHEQYFYPDYPAYLSDYRERLFSGVAWCVRNGYRSVWVDDIAFEK